MAGSNNFKWPKITSNERKFMNTALDITDCDKYRLQGIYRCTFLHKIAAYISTDRNGELIEFMEDAKYKMTEEAIEHFEDLLAKYQEAWEEWNE